MMETQTWTSRGAAKDTRDGLTADPKWLSSLYFYDEEGSLLFDAICATPEYYPTRTEEAILQAHAGEILATAGGSLCLAELGSGSSQKTRVLLEALLARQGPTEYLPVDISAKFLEDVARDLVAQHDGLTVIPIADEYAAGLRRIGSHPCTRRLVLFLGSSIGNFEPEEQVGLLRAAHDALSPGDAFLLGTDLVKDVRILEAAYNDAQGATAAFNKNILRHLDRVLGGNADPEAFRHVAIWNAEQSRIEMHLESTRHQVLRFTGAELEVPVGKGERIHTENSYKFTVGQVQEMARQAGFTPERSWSDPNDWFAVHLLRV